MINKNYSLYNLPEKVIFCKKCVVSNQRPNSTIEFKSLNTNDKKGIKINEEGICDACTYNEIKKKSIGKKEKKILLKSYQNLRKIMGIMIALFLAAEEKIVVLLHIF